MSHLFLRCLLESPWTMMVRYVFSFFRFVSTLALAEHWIGLQIILTPSSWQLTDETLLVLFGRPSKQDWEHTLSIHVL